MATCRIEGCDRDNGKGGKGYCSMHYARVVRTGTHGPIGSTRIIGGPVADRVYPRLRETPGGCWEWTRATRNGYGAVGIGQKVVYVHRWVYEDMVAEIPDGLVIDHLCENRRCANPEHLDVVTPTVNKERGGRHHGTRRRAG